VRSTGMNTSTPAAEPPAARRDVSVSDTPTASVRVPRRYSLERPNAVQIAALLRRRLLIVCALIVGTTTFFAAYRAATPTQWQFFRASSAGTALILFEATVWAAALANAVVLWRRRTWSLGSLRRIEFLLIAFVGLYVAWSQVYAWDGSRFGADAAAPLDPFILRQAIDSMALRWVALIVGISTLIPETPVRNTALVLVLAFSAIALTAYVGLTDAAFRPHLIVMLLLMGMWMTLASTIGIFGSYKLAELRREVDDARQLGQYRLIRRIGAGNMGEVHLAEHLLLKQPCAIKLIRPERAADAATLSLFEKEVQATARLNHWNTIRIYDYGYTNEGTFYYVMEHLRGWTFDQLVQQHGPVPPGRAIHLLRQVCAALREAHSMGLVHRDVKPANIMVCRRGGVADLVKLLDFGLVRRLGSQAANVLVTTPGLLTGTPAYMSPEQARGDAADERSDIYSLGAVAYFLLTGQPPFPRTNAMHVLMAHVRDVPPLPTALQPDIPGDLEAVILRCLAKDPAERFSEVQRLDGALAACSSAKTWAEADAEIWWRSCVPLRDEVAGPEGIWAKAPRPKEVSISQDALSTHWGTPSSETERPETLTQS
jgi:serine/threonine protein kinase